MHRGPSRCVVETGSEVGECPGEAASSYYKSIQLHRDDMKLCDQRPGCPEPNLHPGAAAASSSGLEHSGLCCPAWVKAPGVNTQCGLRQCSGLPRVSTAL